MLCIFVLCSFAISGVAFAYSCDTFKCSNVLDPVCGFVEPWRGLQVIGIYHNICHLAKMKCRYKAFFDIHHAPDHQCNIKRDDEPSGRRVYDFSIVGAIQACNHTCPTHCADIYEPACAQIWKPGMERSSYRPMINHCHIDLYSCTVGLNVTIQPLGKCYTNPSALIFMSQVAALKSLHLIDEARK
ncbi:uncharacterized protein LOC106138642 [Amyelois transitella]|uniref:uncharacterized protein LOC106138642 n=1 Tax=Amyelois transitella TaxID=680683 RepID=UPI0029904F9F|nr:uncharacterized protein LOC106138642 [Amyelois transitella]